MTWPLAEHTVSRDLVRALLARHFSELASLLLRRAGERFDNVQWRLGELGRANVARWAALAGFDVA